MPWRSSLWMLTWVCACGAFLSTARGAEDGQADLDRAIDAKLAAKEFSEIGEVIALCQTALDKGLDEENTDLAQKLLASTLLQRGSLLCEAIFGATEPDPRLAQMWQMAVKDLDRALKYDTETAETYVLLARLKSLPLGNREEALTALDSALKLPFESDELHAQALLLRGELGKDLDQRRADLTEAIKLAPADPKPLRARAALELQLRNFEECLSDIDAALALDPNDANTHQAKGRVLMESNQLEQARQSFARARELAPGAPEPLLERARASILLGDAASAIADLSSVLERDEGDLQALYLRSQARLLADDSEGALEDANQLVELAREAPMALRARASVLANTGKFAEAAQDLERIISQSDEPDVETLDQLGNLYLVQKRPKKAIRAYTRALNAMPKDVAALRGRADAYLSVGKQSEAIADYELALEITPQQDGVLNNLAWVLATSTNEKIRNGKRAIELATLACDATEYKMPHILSTLAAAYAESGDFETAKRWSKQAVNLADETMKANLAQELASYEEKKPWREELKDEDQEQDDADSAEEKQPATKKPASDKSGKKTEARVPKPGKIQR